MTWSMVLMAVTVSRVCGRVDRMICNARCENHEAGARTNKSYSGMSATCGTWLSSTGRVLRVVRMLINSTNTLNPIAPYT